MASIMADRLKKQAAQNKAKLPVSAIIRPGTKAISNKAKENPFALAQFKLAQTGQISFKEAEKAIVAKTDLKYPFFPKNTEHFNIAPCDLEGGGAAYLKLLDDHGQIDTDNQKRLYRIPVVFPDMPVDKFFESQYSMPAGAIKYQSEDGEDGKRRCVYRKPVDRAENGLRKKFMARDFTIRGDCEPAKCPEYGAGTCKFNGKLHFYIPELSGSGFCMMPTGSAYAAEDIYARLEEIQRVCGGKLPVVENDRKPVFFLTKKRVTRKYFDEAGNEKNGDQWVPVVETTVMMAEVMRIEEAKRLRLEAPRPAPNAPSAPSAWMTQSENLLPVPETVPSRVKQSDSDIPTNAGNSNSSNVGAPQKAGGDDLSTLIDLCESHGTGEQVSEWAIAKYGERWDEANTVKDVLEDYQSLVTPMGVERTKAVLPILTMAYANKIPVTELVKPYIKQKFGAIKTENAAHIQKHLSDLIAGGVATTIAHMEAELKLNQ